MPRFHTRAEWAQGGDGRSDFQTPTSGVAPNGLPYFSWDQGAVQLNREGWSWNVTLATPVSLTYAFRATGPIPAGSGVSVFATFNPTQIAVAEEMLDLWAEVANITFTRVGSGYSNDATILFGNFTNGPPQFSAFAYLPEPGATASDLVNGDVWVNVSRDYDANPLAFPLGAQILLHEIGHALGLLHPSDYGGGAQGGATYTNDADFWQDTRQFTVMTYFSETFTGASYGDRYVGAPQMFDIAAAQYLYGANMTTRTGDTVYGFNSNAGHNVFSITSAVGGSIFCIWDAGGVDTLDLSGYATNSHIDLRPESFSSAGSHSNGAMIGNISIARGAIIENAIGGSGADLLIGNDVANVLNGGGGVDVMRGGLGDDAYIVDNQADSIEEVAGQGTDSVHASVDYVLAAEVENLLLVGGAVAGTGNALANQLTGNSANNILDGGANADLMSGADGDDTYYVDNSGDVVVEALNGGTDTIRSTIGIAALVADVENLVLLGAAVTGNGNALANGIVGNAQNNFINGFAGADAMTGGLGNDTYFVDDIGDWVVESLDEGTDIIFSTVNIASLALNVENLTISGAASIATGNFLNNVINGNSGANTLNGGIGEDTLAGGIGNDLYVVNSAGDVVTENLGAGTDSILAFIDVAALAANVENVTLAGAATSAVGNELNNILTGNGLGNTLAGGLGNDQLNGAGGADTMSGGQGDDAYLVENLGDVVIEASGEGTDIVYAYVSVAALADNVERVTIVGAGDLNAAGNALANRVNGNANNNVLSGLDGADVIQGLAGADTINGGAGLDVLTGGAGADTFVLSAVNDSGTSGATRDVINDFTQGADLINLTAIDAITGGGDDAFSFIGAAGFSSVAGQLRYDLIDNASGADYTIISFDVNGDGVADSQITLVGLVALAVSDFGL